MLFPTTLILAVLSITPALAAPVLNFDSDASLVARDLADEQSFVELVARSPEPEPLPEPFPIEGGLDNVEERRWLGALFKIGKVVAKAAHKGHQAHQRHKNRHGRRDLADEESFEELVARSPEPEPLPEPVPIEGGLDNVEERRWLGALFKIGKVVAKAAHKGHQAHQRHKNRHGRRDLANEESFEELVARAPEPEPRHHEKRSKIGRKFKNFFKKAAKGIAKVASFVMRRSDEGAVSAAPLVARSVEEPIEIEARSIEEPIELEARDVEELVELEARDFEEPIELEARDVEESIDLEARDFDEVEIEARDVEEPIEIEARDVEEVVELEARDVDEPMELEARDFDETVELEARDFEEEEF